LPSITDPEALYLEVAIMGIEAPPSVRDPGLLLYMALRNAGGFEEEPGFPVTLGGGSEDLDIPITVVLE
jgi:hypothetical protein